MDRMRKITELVSGLSFPACVVDSSGELAFINPAMRHPDADGTRPSKPGFCSFTPSGASDACVNCSHHHVTQGRCAIPRVTPSSRLVMAVGLEKQGGFTVAFYSNGFAADPMEAHAAVGEILSLAGYAGKGESRPAKVSTHAGWEAAVHLKELVKLALDGLDFGGAGLDLNVGGEVSMDFASLSAARLIIRRMAVELLRLEPTGTLMARSFLKPGEDATTHVLSMQVDAGRLAAKSLLNEISAMELRLSGYCLRLGRMMGLSMPVPIMLVGEGKTDLRFEVAGGFPSSEGHGRNSLTHHAFQGLSSREQQVVAMVAAGLANDEISRKLGITASTVKQHIKNIYRRTGVKNRLELILRAGG